jgi:hypothetical protein
MKNALKQNIEDWSKPFVACVLGMTSGIDLSLGHFFIAGKTATITLLLSFIIKKVKN